MTAPAERATDHDVVVVGSGAGALTAALAAAGQGQRVVVVEKRPFLGGSTALSGGTMWLPANPLALASGLDDTSEDAATYLDGCVSDTAPGALEEARRSAFLKASPDLCEWLMESGVPLRLCRDYPDYEVHPGSRASGRVVETELLDVARLGALGQLMSPSPAPVAAYSEEVAWLGALGRGRRGRRTAARVLVRTVGARARRQTLLSGGAALVGWLSLLCRDAGVEFRVGHPVRDLLTDDGAVTGVRLDEGTIRSRSVVLAHGGFSRSTRRDIGSTAGRGRSSWSSAQEGDTGDLMDALAMLDTRMARTDEFWWVPSALVPGPATGSRTPLPLVFEKAKPHSILVDQDGRRFVDEGASYMRVGQAMVSSERAAQAWLICDIRHRHRYVWGSHAPGRVPRAWLREGAVIVAASLGVLARRISVPEEALTTSIARFNSAAIRGEDPDFGRGQTPYGRYYGDASNRPNPSLGTIEKAPFLAVRVVPGDIGCAGGLVTDEHARVLRSDDSAVAGLYATGNATASVMGRSYPGAGASIAAAMVFGRIAALDAAGKGGIR